MLNGHVERVVSGVKSLVSGVETVATRVNAVVSRMTTAVVIVHKRVAVSTRGLVVRHLDFDLLSLYRVAVEASDGVSGRFGDDVHEGDLALGQNVALGDATVPFEEAAQLRGRSVLGNVGDVQLGAAGPPRHFSFVIAAHAVASAASVAAIATLGFTFFNINQISIYIFFVKLSYCFVCFISRASPL